MSLLKKIDSIQKNFKAELASSIGDSDKINDLHNKYLSRKGILSTLFSELADANSKDKPILGQKINSLRKDIQDQLNSLDSNQISKESSNIDLSLPGDYFAEGNIHPITKVIDDISNIFKNIGFSIFSGNEVEDDFYNFEALNIPKHHPACDSSSETYGRAIHKPIFA